MFLKRLIKIFKYLVITLAILFILVLAGINLPFSQRIITKKANDLFQVRNLPVHVERITLLVSGKLGLSGIKIFTAEGDTSVFAQRIKVSVRIIPLLFRNVKIKNVALNDATIYIATDPLTGKIDLLSLFSQDAKPVTVKEKKENKRKKWDIRISSVSLNNIRFRYDDIITGTQIQQSVGRLNIGLDMFSLVSHEIFISNVDLEKVNGSITLKKPPADKKSEIKATSDWKFKLRQSDLRNILFTIHQPEKDQRYEFSLNKGEISDVSFDLACSYISVNRLFLDKPGVYLFSSPVSPQPGQGSKGSSGADFPGSWDITGNDIKISDGNFRINPFNSSSSSEYEDPYVKLAAFNTTLKDVKLNNQESGFNMNHISFELNNDLKLDKGEVAFRSDSTSGSSLEADLRTVASKLHLKVEAGTKLSSLIRSWQSIPLSLKIDNTEISARDFLVFFPHLKDHSSLEAQENFRLGIECSIEGKADLLNIRNLILSTGSDNSFSASGNITGITDPATALCSLTFGFEPVTRSKLIELIDLTGSSVNLPDFEPLIIKGSLSDSLLAPDFMVSLQSLSGNIDLDGTINIPEKRYNFKIAYSGLELGVLSGISELGRISGKMDFSGKEFATRSLTLKASVTIDTAGYMGYNYRGIHAELEGDNGLFNFGLNSSDKSFECNLTGSVALKDSLKKGEISGTFDLDAGTLNLFKDISISGDLRGDIYLAPDDLNTSVHLKNLVLSTENGSEDLKSLSLSFQSVDTAITGMVESDFLKAAFHIAGSLGDLQRIFKEGRLRIATVMDSSAQNRIPYISALPQTSVSIESEYDPVIGLLLNDSIFSYHKIKAEIIKDTTGLARADVFIDRFNFGAGSGFGTNINIKTLTDKSVIMLSADSMKYGKIKLTEIQADISTAGDSAIYRFKASDKDDKPQYDLSGVARKVEDQIRLRSTQSQWILNGFNWSVSPGDFLILDPEHNDFRTDLHWTNDQRSIDIYGMKSEKLNLELNKVVISTLLVPGMNTYGYDGELSGKIEYQGDKKTKLDIQLDVNQMKMAESKLGDLKITGNYFSDTTGKVESDIRVVMNDTSILNLALRYGKDGDQKMINTDFSGFSLEPLESLVSKYINGLQGEISGEVSFTSKVNKPLINGEIQITNTGLKVVPLNALFYIQDEVVKLENSNLVFSQFTIIDSLKKRLTVNGTIDLNDPDNIKSDLLVSSDLLQVMNTTAKDNQAFNGSVFVNSNLRIYGPVQKPAIEGSIVLAKGTVINYKYSENLSVSETQKVITFASLTQEQDSGTIKQTSINPMSKSADIEATIEIDPLSLFNFQISRGFDIGVSIRGGGFLTYSLMPNREMDLTGTYEINEGSSELKIPGWPRKDFIITPGSYLKWDGKVDDPELQVETTSKVRGSYLNPVDGKTREVNFLVYMKLAGTLTQLEIIFDVRSEDQYITSVFNSLSADERMRQAINLLIFGSIQLPNLSSSSDYVTQQINQFWESQLNQITKSAIKKVDVSIGVDTYTGATEGGGEQTYTSLSYQVKKEMFRDRGSVLVSGHMNDNSPASQQSNNVIENFIFEYALDTNRTKFLKIYRQQNYEDLLEGEVTKSGVGFIYRKSYDKLSDIWRRQKRPKK